ncbi:MAG: histone deacetylase [archaeon]
MVDFIDEWDAEKKSISRRNLCKNSLIVAGLIAVGSALGFSGAPNSGLDIKKVQPIEQGARVVWHPAYGMPWFDNAHKLMLSYFAGNHAVAIKRFPELSLELVDDGLIDERDIVVPDYVTRDDLKLVHTEEYIQKLEKLVEGFIPEGMTRRGENKISNDLYEFIRASVGGTYTAADIALKEGSAMNLSGGFHHAFPDHEEGFCFYNDVSIAIKKLFNEGKINSAMIVDLDTHHGNANASIFENDSRVTIFDMYERENYPRNKIPVDYGIELSEGTDDREYLQKLESLDLAVSETNPDIVFYLAGADPFEGDILGNQKMTIDGLKKRDEYVVDAIRGKDIPMVTVLAGGYSPLEDLVEINKNTAEVVLR